MPQRSTAARHSNKSNKEDGFPESAMARSRARALPSDSLPAAALLSFLKETRGATNWTLRDFARALNLKPAAAKQAAAILQMQGYAKPSGSKGEWITTPQGEIVSGSKFPRYSRASVERSLDSFAEHLERINRDSSAPYGIADAVAFGDFLSTRARVQAADVGIRLVPRNASEDPSGDSESPGSAGQQKREAAFLKQLRGRTPLLNVLPYGSWMSARTHRNLLSRKR